MSSCYALTFFFVAEDLTSCVVKTHTLRSKYYAVATARLCALMEQAGFHEVQRLDGVFYQPVLVGTRRAGTARGQLAGRSDRDSE